LEMISCMLTSGDWFSAISVRIFPPVPIDSRPKFRSVCLPKSFAPLQSMGRTERQRPPRKLPCRVLWWIGGRLSTGPMAPPLPAWRRE
jgi:hypothetical protein